MDPDCEPTVQVYITAPPEPAAEDPTSVICSLHDEPEPLETIGENLYRHEVTEGPLPPPPPPTPKPKKCPVTGMSETSSLAGTTAGMCLPPLMAGMCLPPPPQSYSDPNLELIAFVAGALAGLLLAYAFSNTHDISVIEV